MTSENTTTDPSLYPRLPDQATPGETDVVTQQGRSTRNAKAGAVAGIVAAAALAVGVTQDDIAEAATAVLLSPTAHIGRTYDLTGPQALTLTEAARLLSVGLGREIRYAPETVAETYQFREVYEAPARRPADRLTRLTGSVSPSDSQGGPPA